VSCTVANGDPAPPGAFFRWHGRCCPPHTRTVLMTDLLIVALTVALFAATVGFARLCERM
jgi:hypothetical protein